MIESNKTICKTCKEIKIRIHDGYFGKSKNKRYVDEYNWLWAGKICPVCNLVRVRNKMKEKREKNKKDNSIESI